MSETAGKHPTVIDGIPCYAPELAFENDSFAGSHFGILESNEDRNFWFRSRQRIIEMLVLRYVTFGSPSFFEIGCGTGFVLKGLSKLDWAQLSGGELHLEGAKIAQRRLGGIRIIQVDCSRLPFQSEFEAVGAFDVIEHISDDAAALRGIHQALKPKGILFLTVPQHRFLWSRADEIGRHKRRYSRREICAKLSDNGFTVEFVTSFVFFLLPAMWLSRFLKTKGGSEQDGVCELNLPDWINRTAEAIMRCEEYLIERGVSLPCGGSLAVVARKSGS
jgi:SAM-dependent methyltransferase